MHSFYFKALLQPLNELLVEIEENYKIKFINWFFFLHIKDHPIHPPAQQGDPFDIEILPNLKCTFKNENGVIHIYDEGFKKPQFNDILYPELKMFIDDYLLMVNLISNGPL